MSAALPEEERPPEEVPPLPAPARSRNREAWVGLFVIVGLVAVVGSLLVLTDAALFRGRYILKTQVGNAGGIRRGDPVHMRGVNIGRVQRFKIAAEGVEIRLELEGQYDVPADSHVELKSSGLLGGMVADVIPGTSEESLGNGDTIPGRTEEGMLEVSNRIAGQVETVLGRMESLLSKRTIQNVEDSAGEMNRLLKQLQATVGEQRREISDLTASLRRASEGLERTANAPELERSVKRLDDLTRKMDDVTASLDRSSRSMESVMGRIERGEGVLGKLTTDEALYDNLSEAAARIKEASVDIGKLAEDIRRNPKRYISVKVF